MTAFLKSLSVNRHKDLIKGYQEKQMTPCKELLEERKNRIKKAELMISSAFLRNIRSVVIVSFVFEENSERNQERKQLGKRNGKPHAYFTEQKNQ